MLVVAAILVAAGLLFWVLRAPGEHRSSPALDYDRLILLDAEDLAEGGIGRAYEDLLPELRNYVREPRTVAESHDHDTPRYAVRCGAWEYVVHGPEVGAHESWGRATFAFFRIVNDQLADAQVRLYAVNGGNDLGGILLTQEKALAARSSLLNPRDWPYLPEDRPPSYGQHR
jgi:hypothetical protein